MPNTVRHPGLNHAQIRSILQVKLITRIQTLARPSYCQEPPTYITEDGVKENQLEEFTNKSHQLGVSFVTGWG